MVTEVNITREDIWYEATAVEAKVTIEATRKRLRRQPPAAATRMILRKIPRQVT